MFLVSFCFWDFLKVGVRETTLPALNHPLLCILTPRTLQAMVLQAIFSLMGCIAIAFAFGWKLTLLALCVALPIIIAGTFYRFRYEIQFETMNQAVFAESSKVLAKC